LLADYTTLVFHNGRLHLCYQHFFGNSSTKKSNLQFFACEDVYQTVKSKHPPITMVGIEPTSLRFALPLSYIVVLLLISAYDFSLLMPLTRLRTGTHKFDNGQ